MPTTHQISFLIGAALAGGFMSSFAKANNTVGELQKTISNLSKTSGQIENYKKLQQRITTNQAAMIDMSQKARTLSSQLKNMPSGAIQFAQTSKEMNNLTSRADALQKKLDKDTEALSRLKPELVSAGVDTKNLAAEQARLTEQATKMQQANERLQQVKGNLAASKQRLSWGNMKSEVLTSAGIVLALKAPIQQAAAFEQAMAKVGAVSGATGKDFDNLSAQARQLGRDTQFTSMQAANSQEMLARAGFKTQEIIDTMPALLDMAAAEGMDLASGADIMSSVLRGYQLAAKQSTRVADVLAKTSASSNTSISTLGESMKMVGPIAAGLNVPFEETAAMIGVMGNAGIKGTMAGTALRAALTRLSKEPKMAAEALGKLGISTRDAAGNLRTMPSLMQALSEKMVNMGDADKMKYLTEIFGQEAASGMLAVMEAAKSGELGELTEEIIKAEGAAKTMAERMNDTAQGAMKRLGSASESLMIDIGNVLLPTFTGGVEVLARFTGGLSALAQEFPMVTKFLVGGVAALGAYKVASTATSIAWTAAKLPFQHIAVFMAKMNAEMVLGGHASIWAMAKTKALTVAMRGLGLAKRALLAPFKLYRSLLKVNKLIIYKGVQLAVAVVTKGLAAAQWLLNAALSNNPIGWVVKGLIVAGAALYYAYTHSEAFRKAVHALWEGLKKGVGLIFSVITTPFIMAWEGIKNIDWGRPLYETIASVINLIADVLTSPFRKAAEFIRNIKWLGFIAPLVANAMDGVIDLICAPFRTAASIIANINWLGSMQEIIGGILVGIGEFIVSPFRAAANIIGQIQWLGRLGEICIAALNLITDIVTAPFNAAKDAINSIRWLSSISEIVADALKGIVNIIIAPFKAAWDIISGWFGSFFSSNSAKLDADIAKLNNVPNVSLDRGGATNLSYTPEGIPIINPIPSSATGGIFNTPQVRLFAEAGAEAVIPLTDRSRGIPLWKAAGEAMGMSYGGSATTNNNMSAFSPNINITVNGGDTDVARRVADEVRRVLRDIQEYNDRTQLA